MEIIIVKRIDVKNVVIAKNTGVIKAYFMWGGNL